jgi:hypothetical protein
MKRSDIMIRTWRRIAVTTSTLPQGRTAKRKAQLGLETLEDRCLLSAWPALAFDSARGALSIFGGPGGATAQVSVTSGGGDIAVTIDGQVHSSDPAAASYDPALAGLATADLHELSVIGGGAADQLSLGNLNGSDLTISSDGILAVDGAVNVMGRLALSGQVIINTGRLSADGNTGGEVRIDAGNFQNSGSITADGVAGDGGTVHIAFTGAYIETTSGLIAADGNPAGHGGQVTIDGEATGHLFSSGTQEARGGSGGSIALLARDLNLVGSVEDVSAMSGAGGHLLVRAEGDAEVYGHLIARGGVSGGAIEVSAGGKLTYGGDADAAATAGPAGSLLLDPKNLVVSSSAPIGVFPQYNFIDPHPSSGGSFGSLVVPLATGNVVITNPTDNLGGSQAGAAYLFNGLTGALISALTGSHANDEIGSNGVIPLANGNYVVASPLWNGFAGAVTWSSGMGGISGTVSTGNSLVGSSGDLIGWGVAALTNGNYVSFDPQWNGQRGAATWGSGTTGVTGVVSAANSLVGSNAFDDVGGGSAAIDVGTGAAGIATIGGVTPLSNGNYVVRSPVWNAGQEGGRGAVTWGNGTSGVVGTISADNSLVGTTPGTYIGSYVTALTNGNYVVDSPEWDLGTDNDLGAVTWGNGTTGTVGTVSAANSLVGTHTGVVSGIGDLVGKSLVTALANGNYVVGSPEWSDGLGAVTWASGNAPTVGTVSASNSLIGATAGDHVGETITALSNGNYVVASPRASRGDGAVTWGNGTTGTIGTVSIANSLVGSNLFDFDGVRVTALTNGNYVVSAPRWSNSAGAATWGNGNTGVVGTVSPANSLIGPVPGDHVGDSIIALSNGNYVVGSPHWSTNRGAVTWGNGATGVFGNVSAANSLVGTTPGDGGTNTSDTNAGDMVGSGQVKTVGAIAPNPTTFAVSHVFNGIVALPNGNYVVDSFTWNNKQGAVTWANGATGLVGVVSAANSLVGTTSGDMVGSGVVTFIPPPPIVNGFGGGPADVKVALGITVLTSSNYVITSPSVNGSQGAATWVSGTTGFTLDGAAIIDAQNSLIGQAASSGLGNAIEDAVNHTFLAIFHSEGTGRVTAGFVDANLLSFARGQSQTIAVTPDLLTRTLNTGTAVVLQASNDITVSSAIVTNNITASGDLTLDAGRSILLSANISTSGKLTLIANDTLANGVVDAQRDAGNAAITMASGVTLNTGAATLAIDLRTSTDKTNNGKGAATLLGLTAGSVTLSPATVLGVTLGGTTPGDGSGTTYTQTNVGGPINLGGATLALASVGGFSTGQTFAIVKSTQSIVGTFAGLPEGGGVVAGGQTFKISYQNNQVTLLVAPTITFTPSPLPAGMTGTVYSQTLTGSGGTTPYQNFIVTAGALPAGLTLSSGGTISGTPTATGAFTFTVQATDSSPSPGPYPGVQTFTLVVTPPGFVYDSASKTLTITAPAPFEGSNFFGFIQLSDNDTFNLTGRSLSLPETLLDKVLVNAAGPSNYANIAIQRAIPEAIRVGNGGGKVEHVDAQGNLHDFLTLTGFQTVVAGASAGVQDFIEGFIDSTPGVKNVFVGAGSYAYMNSGNNAEDFYYIQQVKFVYGYSSGLASPNDFAYQYDGNGPSTLVFAGGNYNYMTGTDQGRSFFNEAVGFKATYGIARHAGDTAYFYDSPGNDVFAGYSDHSYMYSANSDGSLAYIDAVQSFEQVYAYSIFGGTDYAYNYDPTHVHTSGFIRLN